MIKIAICDDEPNIRAYLSSLVKKQNTECEITEYASADEYLSADKEHDLLFLDIEMQDSPSIKSDTDKNGMWLAKEIRSRDNGKQPIIIFVTGYEEYVYDAFDVDALHYLIKPINTQKFAEVFDKAVKQISVEQDQQKKMLVILLGDTRKAVAWNDIYYLESRNHKVVLYTKEGKLEYYARLEDLEAELQGQFYRIHRGYLVNLSYIDEYDKTEVRIVNGDKLLLSRRKYNDFVKAYLRFMR